METQRQSNSDSQATTVMNDAEDADSPQITTAKAPPPAQDGRLANGLEQMPTEESNPDAEKDLKKQDKKLVWKLDCHLMPWLCFLYLLAFLDRTNIGNAKIAGLLKDLNLSTLQYNLCLSIFFIAYAVAEPITNVLLKRLRPSIFIPCIVILWGTCMTFMGCVQSFSGLMVCRFFLGLTEAGLFPGVNYYLSCWYKRSEFGIRAAIFFSAAAIAGSFGGLLAAAISQMAGIAGKPGWAWIFILEGIFTVIMGFVSFKMVHDFPDEAKFLSPDDRARVISRLAQDKQASASHERFQGRVFRQALTDWKTWLYCMVYSGCAMPLYAFSLFLPQIVAEMGFGSSLVTSQLMTVPPYVLGAMCTVIVGYYADRSGRRGIWNVEMAIFGAVGFTMLLVSDAGHVQYVGTFLGAIGIYPCIANTITWTANNIEGVYKRGVVLGMVIGWGNLNGVVSSHIYFDGPRYRQGHGIVLGYLVVFLMLGSLLMWLLLARENKQRKQGKKDYLVEGLTEAEVKGLDDNRPDFIYTI